MFACPLFAQTYTDIQASPTHWSLCTKAQIPPCDPGGDNKPTSWTQTFGPKSVLTLTGPGYSNGLATWKIEAPSAGTLFRSSFKVTVTTDGLQTFESDMYKFNNGTEWMWGSQCNIVTKVWQIWTQAPNPDWVDTTIPCTLKKGIPSLIQWQVRVVGLSMLFETLTIDGKVYQVNSLQSAGPMPSSWSPAYGIQFQLDQDKTGLPTSATIEDVSFIVVSPPRPPTGLKVQ